MSTLPNVAAWQKIFWIREFEKKKLFRVLQGVIRGSVIWGYIRDYFRGLLGVIRGSRGCGHVATLPRVEVDQNLNCGHAATEWKLRNRHSPTCFLDSGKTRIKLQNLVKEKQFFDVGNLNYPYPGIQLKCKEKFLSSNF